MAARRSDARLWARIADEFHAAGVTDPGARQLHARRVVALVRRARATGLARTFAPGEAIPYDVTVVYDLDGDIWERQATGPVSSLRDSWKMPGFDPDEHEPACGGVWITPWLLEQYGPMTEVPQRARRGTRKAGERR